MKIRKRGQSTLKKHKSTDPRIRRIKKVNRAFIGKGSVTKTTV